MSDAPQDFAEAYRLVATHSGLAPADPDAIAMVAVITMALTAARIEGERQGLERAIERLEKRAEASITHSAEQQIRWDIKALYDLIAKDIPNDH